MKANFHYSYKDGKMISLFYEGEEHVIKNLVVNVPCWSKWNDTKPSLVMEGYAEHMDEIRDYIILSNEEE